MGKIGDWNKVFDFIEYLDFECVMSFLPIEEESNEYEWENVKKEALFENEKMANEVKRSVNFFSETRSLFEEKEEEKEEESVALRNSVAELWEREIEKSFEEGFVLEKILPKEEPAYEVFSFLPDERELYGKEEKTTGVYEEARENVKPLDRMKRSEVIKSVREETKDNTRVQIEMKRREVPYQDVDMDRIEEMLTLRLCDMMQKSAAGYYI